MFDALTLTETLAALIGLYFVAAGIGLLRERETMVAMIGELKAQPALAYLGAVMAFAIGGALVAIHNDWSSLLAGFVSLVGWISLIEGVLLLAARGWFMDLVEGFMTSDSILRLISIGTLAVGILLLFCALF